MLLLILGFVVAVIAAVGGLAPGLVASIVGAGLANYYVVPPTGSLTVASPETALALGMFIAVGRRSRRVATLVDRWSPRPGSRPRHWRARSCTLIGGRRGSRAASGAGGSADGRRPAAEPGGTGAGHLRSDLDLGAAWRRGDGEWVVQAAGRGSDRAAHRPERRRSDVRARR